MEELKKLLLFFDRHPHPPKSCRHEPFVCFSCRSNQRHFFLQCQGWCRLHSAGRGASGMRGDDGKRRSGLADGQHPRSAVPLLPATDRPPARDPGASSCAVRCRVSRIACRVSCVTGVVGCRRIRPRLLMLWREPNTPGTTARGEQSGQVHPRLTSPRAQVPPAVCRSRIRLPRHLGVPISRAVRPGAHSELRAVVRLLIIVPSPALAVSLLTLNLGSLVTSATTPKPTTNTTGLFCPNFQCTTYDQTLRVLCVCVCQSCGDD